MIKLLENVQLMTNNKIKPIFTHFFLNLNAFTLLNESFT